MFTEKTYATLTFRADDNNDPLVFAFQAARLAVIEAAARRQNERYGTGNDKLTISRPAPTLLMITAYADDVVAIVAALVKAQVFAPLTLEVSDSPRRPSDKMTCEDFAEFIRDRVEDAVIIARPAREVPAS